MNVLSTIKVFGMIKEMFSMWINDRIHDEMIRERQAVNNFSYEPIHGYPQTQTTQRLSGKLTLKYFPWNTNPNSYSQSVNLTACSSIIKSEFLLNNSPIPNRGIWS